MLNFKARRELSERDCARDGCIRPPDYRGASSTTLRWSMDSCAALEIACDSKHSSGKGQVMSSCHQIEVTSSNGVYSAKQFRIYLGASILGSSHGQTNSAECGRRL